MTRYLELLRDLDAAIAAGTGDDAAANAIRQEMELLWIAMTDEEQLSLTEAVVLAHLGRAK